MQQLRGVVGAAAEDHFTPGVHAAGLGTAAQFDAHGALARSTITRVVSAPCITSRFGAMRTGLR